MSNESRRIFFGAFAIVLMLLPLTTPFIELGVRSAKAYIVVGKTYTYSMTLSSATGAVDTTVTLTGTDFPPTSDVQLAIGTSAGMTILALGDMDDVSLKPRNSAWGTVMTDGDGKFWVRFRIPDRGDGPNVYIDIRVDYDLNGAAEVGYAVAGMTTPSTWAKLFTITPALTLSPSSGVPGIYVAISGRGLRGAETISTIRWDGSAFQPGTTTALVVPVGVTTVGAAYTYPGADGTRPVTVPGAFGIAGASPVAGGSSSVYTTTQTCLLLQVPHDQAGTHTITVYGSVSGAVSKTFTVSAQLTILGTNVGGYVAGRVSVRPSQPADAVRLLGWGFAGTGITGIKIGGLPATGAGYTITNGHFGDAGLGDATVEPMVGSTIATAGVYDIEITTTAATYTFTKRILVSTAGLATKIELSASDFASGGSLSTPTRLVFSGWDSAGGASPYYFTAYALDAKGRCPRWGSPIVFVPNAAFAALSGLSYYAGLARHQSLPPYPTAARYRAAGGQEYVVGTRSTINVAGFAGGEQLAAYVAGTALTDYVQLSGAAAGAEAASSRIALVTTVSHGLAQAGLTGAGAGTGTVLAIVRGIRVGAPANGYNERKTTAGANVATPYGDAGAGTTTLTPTGALAAPPYEDAIAVAAGVIGEVLWAVTAGGRNTEWAVVWTWANYLAAPGGTKTVTVYGSGFTAATAYHGTWAGQTFRLTQLATYAMTIPDNTAPAASWQNFRVTTDSLGGFIAVLNLPTPSITIANALWSGYASYTISVGPASATMTVTPRLLMTANNQANKVGDANVAVNGWGFVANEAINIWVGGTAATITAGPAASVAGVLGATITIPYLPGGWQGVQVTGVTTAGNTVTVSNAIQIVPLYRLQTTPIVAADTDIDRDTLTANRRVYVWGLGFKASTQYVVRWNGAVSGTTVGTTFTTDSLGRIPGSLVGTFSTAATASWYGTTPSTTSFDIPSGTQDFHVVDIAEAATPTTSVVFGLVNTGVVGAWGGTAAGWLDGAADGAGTPEGFIGNTAAGTNAADERRALCYVDVRPCAAITPNTGHIGSVITVSGNGFQPETFYDIQVSTVALAGTVYGTFKTLSDGTIPSGTTFTVPAGMATGDLVRIFFQGTLNLAANTVVNVVNTSGQPEDAAADQVNQPALTLNPFIVINPTYGAVATVITITGVGFLPGVTYWIFWDKANQFSNPNPKTQFAADVNGNVPSGVTITVPSGASTGDHMIDVTNPAGAGGAWGSVIVDIPLFTVTAATTGIGQQIFTVFSSSATIGFMKTGNIYDDSAVGFMYAHRNPPKLLFAKTDATYVNQATGAPTWSGYQHLVMVGGAGVNPVLARYETLGSAPLKYAGNSTHHIIVKDSTAQLTVPISSITASNDYFVMEVIQDGTHTVLAFWGLGQWGTYASGVYFDAKFTDLATLTQGWYIIRWQDLNSNTTPDYPAEFTTVASGT